MSEHIEQVQNEALAAVQSAGTMEELTEGHSLEEAFLEADNE